MPPFLWPVTPLLDQHNDSRWWNENKQKQVGDARPERDILVSIKHKVENEMKTIFILWLNGLRTGGANQGRRERAQSVGGRRCRGMAEGIYKEGGIHCQTLAPLNHQSEWILQALSLQEKYLASSNTHSGPSRKTWEEPHVFYKLNAEKLPHVSRPSS